MFSSRGWVGKIWTCKEIPGMFSSRGVAGITSYIWHSTDVRAEWPPFSALPSIWLASFSFRQKYMIDPIFFLWIGIWKAPFFFWCIRHMHISFVQRFSEAACSLGTRWIDCDICLTTSNKWVQKIKGQYMHGLTFQSVLYMNGSIFSKSKYMNGLGFEILARTPVPHLPLSHPSPTAVSSGSTLFVHRYLFWSTGTKGLNLVCN